MIVDFTRAMKQKPSILLDWNNNDLCKCNRRCDRRAAAHGKGLGKFKVTVYGREPHDYVRIYNISAKSDDAAAREGLDKFVNDIEELLVRKSKQ